MEEERKAATEEREKNPIVIFVSNLLASIDLPFLPKKNDPLVERKEASSKIEEPVKSIPAVVEDEEGKSSAIVTFPRRSFVPLKLEAEAKAEEESERNTNPVLLWQVYAVGAFFILRWAWVRWNEHKGRKKPDDEPPRD